jgi:hypothetical protein
MTASTEELKHVWLAVDPDLDSRLRAEARTTGGSPAQLFRGYVIGGLLAEQAGALPSRPTPPDKVRLVSTSLFVPSRLDAELRYRGLSNRVTRAELYRTYLRLGIEVGRPLAHAALAIRLRTCPIEWRS